MSQALLTIDNITPSQIVSLAKIARVNLNRAVDLTHWVNRAEEHIDKNSVLALVRRGVVKYGEALDVVRVHTRYAALAEQCRRWVEEGR